MAESASPTDLFPFLADDAVQSPNPAEPKTSSLVQAAFYDDGLARRLQTASEEALHEAAFGIIRLDERGCVTFYNRYEQRFSGRAPEETIGRDFFDEVAPCTRSRFFKGRFRHGLMKGQLDVTFSYTFTYRMRPTLVDVRILIDRPGEGWVLSRPKAGPGA